MYDCFAAGQIYAHTECRSCPDYFQVSMALPQCFCISCIHFCLFPCYKRCCAVKEPHRNMALCSDGFRHCCCLFSGADKHNRKFLASDGDRAKIQYLLGDVLEVVAFSFHG